MTKKYQVIIKKVSNDKKNLSSDNRNLSIDNKNLSLSYKKEMIFKYSTDDGKGTKWYYQNLRDISKLINKPYITLHRLKKKNKFPMKIENRTLVSIMNDKTITYILEPSGVITTKKKIKKNINDAQIFMD